MSYDCPRIYTRCPACHNDTLTINKGHLLCTWVECPDPVRIDREAIPEDQVPGAWICDKCQFVLQKSTLHVLDGGISADTSALVPERCPNDGTIMRPLTWKEMAKDLNKMMTDLLAREQKLVAALRKVKAEWEEWESCGDNAPIVTIVDEALKGYQE